MFKSDQINTALVLAPHTDDAEFGCGGTIAKLVKQGVAVHCIAFSSCGESLPQGFAEGTLAAEMNASLKSLGLRDENIQLHEFPVRKFPDHRQEILELLVKCAREMKPDLVFLPASNDIHQDHNTIYCEGIRAFKRTRILGYQLPWNCFQEQCNFFVGLDETEVEARIDAILLYVSQRHRPYSQPDLLRAASVSCGMTSGRFAHAEKFEMIRWFA